MRLLVRVYEHSRPVYWGEFTEPVEFGRQRVNEEGPYAERRLESGRWRVVVARSDEQTLSREHVLAEALPGERLRLRNLREKLSIRLADGSTLEPRGERELPLPYRLPVGRRVLGFELPGEEPSSFQTLAHVAIPPGRMPAVAAPFREVAPGGNIEELFRWLQAAVGVLQSAAGSTDFFQKACRAVVDLVGLDSCGALLAEGGDWRPQALESSERAGAQSRWQPSRQILAQVAADRKTVWNVPPREGGEEMSLVGVKAVVAAPILDADGRVIGVLYGDRRLTELTGDAAINQAEALLVELLACGVAAGLARVEQEKAAVRARVRFEQFFTPALARQLAARPDLLEGRNADVSVLFADLRGFSRVSERIGPAKAAELIRDVLAVLSDCVLAREGVLVDYMGDELMAMWGAPEARADHARLACTAALDMLAAAPDLTRRWEAVTGEPVVFGIGVNSGPAHVGNTGTRHKFKYGPLGHTVDLASRTQGANKFFRANLLVTAATHAALGPGFESRRLGRAKLVNMAEPVELFEVARPDLPDWAERRQAYDRALGLFERGELREAAGVLERLLARHLADGAAVVLYTRALQALNAPASPFNPVWELPGK